MRVNLINDNKMEEVKNKNIFTLFLKPWPDKDLYELARLVKYLGFDGVELPIRKNYQVTPKNVSTYLPKAVKIFKQFGLSIRSVTSDPSEYIISVCGDLGIPIIRVMAEIDTKIGYYATEKYLRQKYDKLLPFLDKYGVVLGVQNHCGNMVNSSIGLMHLIEQYDRNLVGAILDIGHCGLAGEPERMAIDIVWSHLVLVNFKNAYWEKITCSNNSEPKWYHHFTLGNQGFASWRKIVNELKRRKYKGDICFSAEYTDTDTLDQIYGDKVNNLIEHDLRYARKLFNE